MAISGLKLLVAKIALKLETPVETDLMNTKQHDEQIRQTLWSFLPGDRNLVYSAGKGDHFFSLREKLRKNATATHWFETDYLEKLSRSSAFVRYAFPP